MKFYTRARLFKEQDGKCFWCKEHMLLSREHFTSPPPRLCTCDHLYDKWSGARAPGHPGPVVAACYECNQRRNQERLASLPIERLWEAGSRPARTSCAQVAQ